MKRLIFLCILIACGLSLSAQTQTDFSSVAAQDGHISADGTVDNTGSQILIGDASDNKRLKGFLAFDTSALPDDASITGARITLQRASVIGDPTSLGTLWIDLQSNAFGANPALESDDFNALAAASRVAPLKDGASAVAILDAVGRGAINLTGVTYFRLAFVSATDDNGAADQLAFHDGGNADPNLHPKLEITYTQATPATTDVTITLDPATVLDDQASRTITGTVSPLDAHLLVNGSFLEPDGSGVFTYTANLHQGVNTLMFSARAYDYIEASAKLDLYLDTEAPIISISSPDNNSYTNETTVDIYGLVQDTYDDNVTLTRDGVAVTLEQGRFAIRDLPLTTGVNTFTFDASDNSGNTATPVVLTVHHKNQDPVVTLTHPQHIASGESYTVDVAVTPAAEVATMRVTINNELVHDGTGAAFNQSFTHDGQTTVIPINVSVRDIYGNIAESEGTISVATSRYLSGRVLNHSNSHPVSGLSVQLVSPYETISVTTDDQGHYEGYVKGRPVDVRIDNAAYVTTQRRAGGLTNASRVPDIRLTQRATSGAGPYDLGAFTATFSGGSAAVTAFDAQALPNLLPLGYSPVLGVEIQGATATGALSLTAASLPQLPAGGQLVLLRGQDHQWLMDATPTSVAGNLQADFSNASDGTYLVALIDPWSTDPVPNVGDLISRQFDYLLTVADLSRVLTNPASVSITDDPSTTFFLKVNDQRPSGSRALVHVQENHQRFDGLLRAPRYQLDITAYHYPEPEGTGLLAALPVTSRETVSPSLTRDARITFQTAADQPYDASFPDDQKITLGPLTIDFSAWTQPLVARGHAIITDDLPIALGSEEIITFELWLGGQLDSAPQLSLDYPAGGGVVLLRQIDNLWTYAGQLTHDGSQWTNDPIITDMLSSGRYALVAFPGGVTEILGTVRDSGMGQSSVRLTSEDHPYAGVTTTDGTYRYFLNQSDQSADINAFDPNSRRVGSRTVSSTAAVTQMTAQDIDLQAPAFALLNHQPAADARFISRNPDIRLNFNMSLTTDAANHSANISLVSSASVVIPLEILPDYRNNQLNVLAKETLLPATTYTLTVAAGLQNIYGDSLAQAASFSFGTLDENATGDLDLARFYLTEENDQLYVNAPADAFPNTTSLSALNMSTADGWTRQMDSSTDFKEAISGLIGDLIDLEATTPDGAVTRLQIDLVQTAPDTWRFGTRPFAVKINNDLTLRVAEVTHGSGKEVTIIPVDSATLTAAADQVAYLQDLGPYTIQPGFKMSVAPGQTLPVIKAQLRATIPDTSELQILSFLSIQENQPFPISPDNPDQLVNINLAELGIPIPIQQGDIQNKRTKFGADLSSISVEMQSQAYWWRENLLHTLVLLPAHPQMTFGSVRAFFKYDPSNPAIVNAMPRPRPQNRIWEFGKYGPPVPNAPIFRATPTGYHPMGFTGAHTPIAGHFAYSGKYWRPRFHLINPYTGEKVIATNFESGPLDIGASIDGTGLSSNAEFDPNYSQDIPFPLADPNNLSVKWEIGTLDEDDFTPDQESSRILQRRNIATVSAIRSIRATLTISDGSYWDEVRVSGSIATVTKAPIGNRFVFDFPAAVLASPAKHFFNFEILKNNDVWQGPKAHITVIDPNVDPSSLSGPPQVLTSSIRNGSFDINPLLDSIAIEFNEDVKGWDTITLSGPSNIDFDLIGSDNLSFGAQDYRPFGRLVLKSPLQYGQTYTLTVDSVTDRDDEVINQTGQATPEPFSIRFRVIDQPEPLIPEDLDYLATAKGPMDILRHGNRFVVYGYHSNHNVIDIWKVNDKASIQLEHSNISTGFNLQNPFLSLFTPSDQDLEGAAIANQSFRFPSTDRHTPLPADSVLMLRGFNYFNGIDSTASTLMNRYDFDGNQFLYRKAFSLPLMGSVDAEARVGHFMTLGTRNRLGETPTLLLDMRRLLIREAELRSRIGHHSPNIDNPQGTGALNGDEFPIYQLYQYRLDVWTGMGAFIDQHSVDDVTSAWLEDQHGVVKPYLFTAGPHGLFMYDFKPSTLPYLNQPNTFTVPYAGLDHQRFIEVVPDFHFIDPITGQSRKEHILVVLQYRNAYQSILSLMTIPRDGAQPETLYQGFPNARYMAVDPQRGLIFTQANIAEGWFYDMRAMLENPSEDMATPGPFTIQEAAMPTVFNRRLHLEGGYLYGIESGGETYKASIYPIDVPVYRKRGFLYADLNPLKQLQSDVSEGEDREVEDGFELKHASGAVLHAWDKPDGQGSATFAMELGTYEIEVDEGETLEVTVSQVDGPTLPDGVILREDIKARNMEPIALAPMLIPFYNAAKQSDLRQNGYHAFEIKITIFKDQLEVFQETEGFMVYFQNHNTEYVDAYRDMGSIDGLTLMPQVAGVDHAMSSGDPRLDISPGRVYSHAFTFQPGTYGVGMLDTQLLHLAMMRVFEPDSFDPNLWHDGEDSETRTIHTMPGKFMIEGRTDGADAIEVINQPRTRIFKEKGSWVVDHLDTARFHLTSKQDLPDYGAIFRGANAHLQGQQDAVQKMRYPLLRFDAAHQAPAAAIQPVAVKKIEDKPWGNRIRFEDEAHKPAAVPTQIWEEVADGARRQIKRLISSSRMGPITLRNHIAQDAVSFQYEYDSDGYLVAITREEEPFQTLEWDPILPGFTLGEFTPKRLRSISRGGETITWQYDSQGIKTTTLTTPFGSKAVSITAAPNGLPAETTLAGVGGAPDQKVGFSQVEGYYLSSAHGSGATTNALTWGLAPKNSNKAGTLFELPVLTHNTYLDQTYEHNTDGMITKFQRFTAQAGDEFESWTYDHEGPFWSEPSIIRQATGESLTVTVSEEERIISHADGEICQLFSPSGAIRGGINLLGQTIGSAATHAYTPKGASLDGAGEFLSRNGRLLKIPFESGDGVAVVASHRIFDRLGRLECVINMGAESRATAFDELDRPTTRIDLGSITHNISHRFENGLYVEKEINTFSGEINESYTDELGRLVKVFRSRGDAGSQTIEYQYDDLGNLTRILDDGVIIQEHSIDPYLQAVTRSVQPDPSGGEDIATDFILTGGFAPKITSMTESIGAKSLTRTMQTDAYGRVIQGEINRMGVSDIQFDAFGRTKSIIPTALNQKQKTSHAINFTYNPDDHSVTVNNSLLELVTITRLKNSSGTLTEREISGAGIDPERISRMSQRKIKTGAIKKGFVFENWSKSGENGVDRMVQTNIHGDYMGGQFGQYATQYTGLNEYGQPTGITGPWGSTTQTYDNAGNLTSLSYGGKTISGVKRDIRGRLNEFTNAKGKKAEYTYQSVLQEVSTIKREGISPSGSGMIDLFNRSSRTSNLNTSWLGASRTQKIDQLGIKNDIVRQTLQGKTAIESTASIITDPTSGYLDKMIDFKGNETQMIWAKGGRELTVQPPTGNAVTYEMDAFGDLRSIQKAGNQNPTMALKRDEEGRVTEVETAEAEINLTYEDEKLISVTGGAQDIFFENFTEQGSPANIRLGDLGDVKLNYDVHGELNCIIALPKGGLASTLRANEFGEVTQIRRNHDKSVNYIYNEWGTPQTMQLGNEAPLALMDSSNPLLLNLPGNSLIELTGEGQIKALNRPGLGVKEYFYDENDRIKEIQIGSGVSNALVRDYTYELDRLAQVRSEADGKVDIRNLIYDVQNRVIAVEDETGSYLAEYTYKDGLHPNPNRLHSYTDPNGVIYTYFYDKHGRVEELSLSNGPVFRYASDEAGNLLSVQVDDLQVEFGGYQGSLPQNMGWYAGGALVEGFNLTATLTGHLDQINSSSGDFQLNLEWDASEYLGQDCNDTATATPPMINKITRSGPGFEEVWEPRYNAELRLTGTLITRNQSTQIIDEEYGEQFKLMTGISRTVNGTAVLDWSLEADIGADSRRIVNAADQLNVTQQMAMTYDADLGNLTAIDYVLETTTRQDISYNPHRRIDEITTTPNGGAGVEVRYAYDTQHRRIRSESSNGVVVYAWQGSRVIAIGQDIPETGIQWTHAIGQGAFGPVFIKDLTYTGHDYFIFTDHLGTPYAYKSVQTGAVFYTPYNPWGELLATYPNPPPTYASEGSVSQGAMFALPPDPIFPFSPLGLAGHLFDHDTGLVYMHNRYYHPRLGHFLTPDFRAPDIYDPTTFTESYAYAAGNPIIYWDPDGRVVVSSFIKAAGGGAVDLFLQMLFSYLFDPNVVSVSQAFDEVNWFQVSRSAAESLIPWKIPGGKFGKAAGSALLDVSVNAVSNENYTREEAFQDFAIGFFGSLAADGFGELIDKYGADAVSAGLRKVGIAKERLKNLIPEDKSKRPQPVSYKISDRSSQTTIGAGPNGQPRPVEFNAENLDPKTSPKEKNLGEGTGKSRNLPDINTKHLFQGELNKANLATGFHYRGGTNHIGKARIRKIVGEENDHGVYKALVDIMDESSGKWVPKKSISTFFPDAWSEARVIEEIRGAFENQLEIPNARNGYWQGLSPSGLRIGGTIKNGVLKSVFPIFE